MVRGFPGAAAIVACIFVVSAAGGQTVQGRATVIDGDTLEIAGEMVRLHAIDAPEAAQRCTDAGGRFWPCGRHATRALRDLARGGVRCDGQGRDRYGRLVARCYAGGQDVAEALVRAGAAFAYPEYGRDYVAAEAEAHRAARGIWQGGAVRPDTLRDRAASAPAASGAPEGCTIKGNVSSNGRIYHMPGQRDYARTRISAARGERWFCSEAQARAAGWRRARR
jgi:endonuclease YncB( thermonuclease family)